MFFECGMKRSFIIPDSFFAKLTNNGGYIGFFRGKPVTKKHTCLIIKKSVTSIELDEIIVPVNHLTALLLNILNNDKKQVKSGQIH